ncbi:MAG: hypothetical protein ACLQVD_17750 [Capsulimonadaceae bacterium]
MLSKQLSYQEYLNRQYDYLMNIRRFGAWRVQSASHHGTYVLILVNDEDQCAMECRYDSWDERYKDVEQVRRLASDGPDAGWEPRALNPLTMLAVA